VLHRQIGRLLANALRTEKPDISDLVGPYAAIARMRVLSSTDVGERAERVAQRIPDTYSEPDKSFAEMRNMAMNHSIDLCMTSAKPAGRNRRRIFPSSPEDFDSTGILRTVLWAKTEAGFVSSIDAA
jgi:hypothetical protein